MVDVTRRGFLKGVTAGIVAAQVPVVTQARYDDFSRIAKDSGQPKIAESIIERPPAFDYKQDVNSMVGDGKFFFDHNTLTIHYVGQTGFTAQEMYIAAKEAWFESPVLVKYGLPLAAVTPEYMILQHNWVVADESWDWMRRGTIEFQDNQTWMTAIVFLGNFDHLNQSVVYVHEHGKDRVEKVDGLWGHVYRFTHDTKPLTWKVVSLDHLYYETGTEQLGINAPMRGHSIYVPIAIARDLNYIAV